MPRLNALKKLEALAADKSQIDRQAARTVDALRPTLRAFGYAVVRGEGRRRKPLAKAGR